MLKANVNVCMVKMYFCSYLNLSVTKRKIVCDNKMLINIRLRMVNTYLSQSHSHYQLRDSHVNEHTRKPGIERFKEERSKEYVHLKINHKYKLETISYSSTVVDCQLDCCCRIQRRSKGQFIGWCSPLVSNEKSWHTHNTKICSALAFDCVSVDSFYVAFIVY